MLIRPMMLRGASGAATTIPIASFSQSDNEGRSGIVPATVANMSDGLAQPSAATNPTAGNFIRATLSSATFVNTVTIGAPSHADFQANYTNGAVIERSANNGGAWTSVATVSGLTASTTTTLRTVTYSVGAVCTDLRIRKPGDYLAISEFTIA